MSRMPNLGSLLPLSGSFSMKLFCLMASSLLLVLLFPLISFAAVMADWT